MSAAYDEVIKRWVRPQVDESWKGDAACATADPDLFFPDWTAKWHFGASVSQVTKVAKSICAGCVVQGECLAYALAVDERHGIWGGLSEREREKLTGKRRDWKMR